MSSSTAIGACTTLPSSFHFHLTIRHSPVTNRCRFTNRQSPIAVVFGSAGASPSHFISSRVPRPSSHAPRPILFPFPVPCPAQGG
jgi:hypothetical protein